MHYDVGVISPIVEFAIFVIVVISAGSAVLFFDLLDEPGPVLVCLPLRQRVPLLPREVETAPHPVVFPGVAPIYTARKVVFGPVAPFSGLVSSATSQPKNAARGR